MTNSRTAPTGELDARAATQRGETGDKIPGFDPAAAPLETDAEAGGAPYGGVAQPRSGETVRPSQASTGTAMRPMMDERAGGRTRGLRVAIALVILAAALAAALLMLQG